MRPEPLYGVRNMYLSNLAGIPLGVARATIDSVLELAEGKQTRIGTSLMSVDETNARRLNSSLSISAIFTHCFQGYC